MPTQLVMPFAPATSYAPEDFIRGQANEAALALIDRWPNWEYSIALVVGEKGAGKTHLAHRFAQASHASFVAPERIGALPADQILVGNHVWVLDGLAQVSHEAALAQLINHVRARGDYLLMTAPTHPRDLPFTLPDLRSRLNALPSVTLGAPDDALLMGVLAKQCADRQLRITPELLRLAAQQLERRFEAVQEFARALDGLSLERGRAITPALMREVLKNPSWQAS